MQVDWERLTQSQASRMIGAASLAEQRAAARWNAIGTPDAESAWLAAFTLWENLRVYAICGEKPE